MSADSAELRPIALRAAELVPEGAVVGLGSGRAAAVFIHVLGERVRAGLSIRGVPTSQASAQLAMQSGIPLIDLASVGSIDVDVDGADEVDPRGNLIKGLGGALLREKIVADASRKVVILVGREKLVPVLGGRGLLPVEVASFGLAHCQRRLAAMGLDPQVRRHDGEPFLTDNGNHILDCRIGPIENPAPFERSLVEIPGVVETGLFLGMADTILIQDGDRLEERSCNRRQA
jgi:ribose 5-phosphate isomerase A